MPLTWAIRERTGWSFRTVNVRTGRVTHYTDYETYAWWHAPGAGFLWRHWHPRRQERP